MPHLELLQLERQPLRLFPKRPQPRVLHLVPALHLPHHQLGVRHHPQPPHPVRKRPLQHRQQPLVLGVIIRLAAEKLAQPRHHPALGILDHRPIPRRPRVSPRPAVAVRREPPASPLRRPSSVVKQVSAHRLPV